MPEGGNYQLSLNDSLPSGTGRMRVSRDGAAGTPVVLRAPSSSWTGTPADAFTPVDAAITQGYRPAP